MDSYFPSVHGCSAILGYNRFQLLLFAFTALNLLNKQDREKQEMTNEAKRSPNGATEVTKGNGDGGAATNALWLISSMSPEAFITTYSAENGEEGMWLMDDLAQLLGTRWDPLADIEAAIDAGAGASLIAVERDRQATQECWTAEHDDLCTSGELVKAAICYASHAMGRAWIIGASDDGAEKYRTEGIDRFSDWPWDESWWKPQDPIRDLARAGALIAAEIDRLQRIAAREAQP
jgi:hypothetical protein